MQHTPIYTERRNHYMQGGLLGQFALYLVLIPSYILFIRQLINQSIDRSFNKSHPSVYTPTHSSVNHSSISPSIHSSTHLFIQQCISSSTIHPFTLKSIYASAHSCSLDDVMMHRASIPQRSAFLGVSSYCTAAVQAYYLGDIV